MLSADIKKFIRSVTPGFIMDKIDGYLYEKREETKLGQRAGILANWEKAGKPVPPPAELKQTVMDTYQLKSGCGVLVETGTYKGDMIEAQRKHFKKIYSIELSDRMYQYAADRFKRYPHIEIIHGDSGTMLETITKKLDEQAIFWLDGHYSSGITAKGDTECPIFGEIDAVFKYKNLNHILLVDDARCFNGQGDYPTIDQLTAYIKNKDPRYEVEVKDDIMRYKVKA